VGTIQITTTLYPMGLLMLEAELQKMMSLTTAQIGRCGELLVQLELLKRGIESAAVTTDTGIDLVAYLPEQSKAITIQVKTNLKAKPGGGKSRLCLDWWIPSACPADFVALSELDSNRIWLFTKSELKECAQQSPEGRFHFFMYTEQGLPRRDGKLHHDHEFNEYLLEQAVHRLIKM